MIDKDKQIVEYVYDAEEVNVKKEEDTMRDEAIRKAMNVQNECIDKARQAQQNANYVRGPIGGLFDKFRF